MEKLLRGYPDTRESRDKTRFARFTRSIINALAVVLGLLIAYLQIKDIRPDALLTPSSADIAWRAALVLYYWSWVGGAKFDTNIQELAYIAFPGQGKWPPQPYAVLVIFVVMAALLLKSYGNITHFSLALTGLLLVDHALWLYLRRFLRKSIDDSRIYYAAEGKFYELEILRMVESYMFGRWKLWRLIGGATIVIAADVFAFSQAFQEVTASAVQIICPLLSSDDAILLSYSLVFLVYVLAMESWLWLNRVRTYLRLDTLEYLNRLYHLTPR
jgi:hypothetical protein